MKATKAKPNEPETIVRLYSMKEACALWGINRYKVYDLIKADLIRPVTNMGKGFKFLASDFKMEFLERL